MWFNQLKENVVFSFLTSMHLESQLNLSCPENVYLFI